MLLVNIDEYKNNSNGGFKLASNNFSHKFYCKSIAKNVVEVSFQYSDVVEPPTHPRALIGQCYFTSKFCTITKTCQHGMEQRAFYIIIIIIQFLFKISKCITASIVLFLLIKWHVK